MSYYLFLMSYAKLCSLNSFLDSCDVVYDLISSPEYGIPDSSFVATSVWNQNVASSSRLNTDDAWFPSGDDEQKEIGVDFGENRLILGIRTRNYRHRAYYTRSFSIYTGIDGSAEPIPLMDSSGAVAVFEIDEYPTDIVNHPLPIPVIARYVRLKIRSFDGIQSAISWAVDGCSIDGCPHSELSSTLYVSCYRNVLYQGNQHVLFYFNCLVMMIISITLKSVLRAVTQKRCSPPNSSCL